MFKQESTVEIPEHLLFGAIKAGIKEAFLEIMESGDGISGIIRTDQIMEAIKDGVTASFPSFDFIEQAIKDGTSIAQSKTHD